MRVSSLVVGSLRENTYILEKGSSVLVVDPGSDYDKIMDVIGNREVCGILITHSHFDHIGALKYFTDVQIYKFDSLKEKEYKIDDFKFEVIFNPGHSSDSVSFYFREDNVLFSGDFIFKNSIGRCDLDTGDINLMRESIDKIKRYDDDIVIYPGHGDKTTLFYEKMYNPYFK